MRSCFSFGSTTSLRRYHNVFAGITMHWRAGPGKKVGIIGLGGLGHMGVKLAHALGIEVMF